MRFSPGRDEFIERASGATIAPVWVDLLGDTLTAVGCFEELAGEGPAFLLESVEGGDRWARWSFLGWDPLFVLTATGGEVRLEGADLRVDAADPLGALEQVLAAIRVADIEGMPPLHTGMVGYLAYDMVRHIERLPAGPPDDRGLPEMLWMGVGNLAAFDRFAQRVRLIRNVLVGADPGADYDRAVASLAETVDRIGSHPPRPAEAAPAFGPAPTPRASMNAAEYGAAVEQAIAHIRAGDAFQVVPSVRFEVDFAGDPFAVYRMLRLLNPSPAMFFIRAAGMAMAGSSPETMVRVRDGRVHSRPIAGTRRRGAGPEEDAALAEELLADPKERAEHVMLVDLARNDLGRVAEFGSVTVDDLMVIERYSHVMHIVSAVSGRLRPGVGPVDVVRATFPHGTVTGAPKVRAMEIIDTLEPVARGPYAGAVGYVDFSGNLETAIALRTMVAAGGRAWVQAGAGVVVDSNPVREYEECGEKAAAVLSAIAAAARLAEGDARG